MADSESHLFGLLRSAASLTSRLGPTHTFVDMAHYLSVCRPPEDFYFVPELYMPLSLCFTIVRSERKDLYSI